MRTLADWWDAQSLERRYEFLAKRSMKVSLAGRSWTGLNRFAREVINDQWWWDFAGEVRPALADGPVEVA